MTDKMRRSTYIMARVLGSKAGDYSPEIEHQTMVDDIRRSKKDIRMVVATEDSLTDVHIEMLEGKLKDQPDINAEVLVGPDYPHTQRLQGSEYITVIELPEVPMCDIRIVDAADTYTQGNGKYCWTFGNVRAIVDRIQTYEELKNNL